MQCQCCVHLGQVGLVGAAQGSGLHMLWYQTLVSENMQGQPLTGWAHVLVDHSVCFCKGHSISLDTCYLVYKTKKCIHMTIPKSCRLYCFPE